MDRMEILKLALASAKDAKEALTLAQQMAEFVNGGTSQAAVSVDKEAAVVMERAVVSKPAKEKRTIKRKTQVGPELWSFEIPATPADRPINSARRWSEQELLTAALMLDQGETFESVGNQVGRSWTGVSKAWRDGLIPCRVQPTQRIVATKGAAE